jgi:mono/diheme cytochrome c family protein
MKPTLFALLAILVATVMLATPAPRHQQQDDAKTLYDANCKKCHGARGIPPKVMKAKFEKIATFDAEFIAKHSKDSIVKVLTKGKGEDMKSFKDKLTPDQMALVATYVHDLAVKKEGNEK